jgi:hypothetical protein
LRRGSNADIAVTADIAINADIAVTADIAGNWMGRVLSFQLDVWTDAYHS